MNDFVDNLKAVRLVAGRPCSLSCDGCPVGGAVVAEQVGAILGQDVEAECKKVARVMCI